MRPDEIAAALRRALRERVFPPGQALNQDELARRFGVSRIPLREALRTLVGEGLILMKPGLGAVVTELSPAEVCELYGLRAHLEPPLAPHIVHRVRRKDVEDLGEMVTRMTALPAGGSEEWSAANYRFHRRLYELSEQRHTVRLVVQVLNLVEPYARIHAHVLGSRAAMQDQRAGMVAALAAGDADGLQALLREAIATAEAELLAAMAQHRLPAEPATDAP